MTALINAPIPHMLERNHPIFDVIVPKSWSIPSKSDFKMLIATIAECFGEQPENNCNKVFLSAEKIFPGYLRT